MFQLSKEEYKEFWGVKISPQVELAKISGFYHTSKFAIFFT